MTPTGPAPTDPEIARGAAQIRAALDVPSDAPVQMYLRAAMTRAVMVHMPPVVAFKAAVLAVLDALLAAGRVAERERITTELDIVFGVSAAAASQPLDLEAVLAALPNGRLSYDVLGIWCDVVSKKKI